ncbi:hypothetical protein AMAG_07988 [Allomyces macrogynus ATCC 38327]|uniref:Uncharacterized protein n=1 Tax=Allomyces macrogynus (strain ATCC 38327) TaxID=578462 RepID=A0A0L0SJZ9_ALLM3|nr:hypothetical protein AMAG_07988 [Allomyces macrogynus ATCC 38327]|eukprot:KNE62807.1 hypothetical protein AMAG_07988 [Allomyces macrogynus ATCC 38327]
MGILTPTKSNQPLLEPARQATVLIAVRVNPSDPAVHVCEPVVLTPTGAPVPLQALLEDKTHPLPPLAIMLLHLLSAVPLPLADEAPSMSWIPRSGSGLSRICDWGLPSVPGLLLPPATALPIPVPGTLPGFPAGNDVASLLAQLQAVQGIPPGPAPAPPAPAALAPAPAPAGPTTTAASAPLPPSMRVSPPARVPSPKRAPTPPAPHAPSPAKTITEERLGPTSIISRIRNPEDVAAAPSPPAGGGEGTVKRPAPAREVAPEEVTVPIAVAGCGGPGAVAVAVPVATAVSVAVPVAVSLIPQAPVTFAVASPAPLPIAVSLAPPVPLAPPVAVAFSPAAPVHSPKPTVIPAPIPTPIPAPAPAQAPSSSSPTDLRALLKPQRTSIKFLARVFPPHTPLPERWLEKVRLALSFFVAGGVHAVQWTARDVFSLEVKMMPRIVERIMELSTMTISGRWVTMTPEDPTDLPADPTVLQRLHIPRALYVLANLPATRLLVELREFLEARGVEGRLDMVGSPFPNCP